MNTPDSTDTPQQEVSSTAVQKIVDKLFREEKSNSLYRQCKVSLRGALLEGLNFEGANCQGTDLREANLRNANLRNANLRNANLQEVCLENTNLLGADLRNAKLQEANLRDANLQGADLRNANLHEANLCNANLREARLENANFDKANLQGTILEDTNLQGTIKKNSRLQRVLNMFSFQNINAAFQNIITALSCHIFKFRADQRCEAQSLRVEAKSVDKDQINITRTMAGSTVIFFIGRDEELANIKSHIANNRKTVLLSGLGGIGKTEICRKLYAQCIASEMPTVKKVGWINYDGDLRSSLYNQFPDVPVGNHNRDLYYRKVHDYLNDAGQELLLIVDDINTVDNEEIKYLDSLLCKVLLTSRQKIDGIISVDIGVLSKEECLILYRTYSKDEDSSNELLHQIIELAACHTLTVELLAKTQRASGKTAEEFLNVLKTYGFALNEIGETVNYKQRDERFLDQMAKVFDIANFENDGTLSEELRVLKLMSLLAFEPVAKTTLLDWFAMQNLNAVNRLVKKGWLTEKTETKSPSILMHPVISAVVRYKKWPDFEMAEPLVMALATKLRMEPTEVFTEKFPFMLHALSVATFFEKETDSAELAELFHNMAIINHAQAIYARALEWYEKARVIKEKVLGKEHPSTATTYNSIGEVYRAQGDYEKALEWSQKALDIKERVLGKEHPSTAMTYNNIAIVYEKQGEYEIALEWCMKDLAISEKVLGNEHPHTAATYNNIASVYNGLGKYEKALEWFEKALAIREMVLGNEHPDTAQTYNNIGGIYHAQGDNKNALEWYEKALAIREMVLGNEHPDTAVTYHNIATVYDTQGDYEEALKCFEKALEINALDKEHSDTVVYDDLGKYTAPPKWHEDKINLPHTGNLYLTGNATYGNQSAIVQCSSGAIVNSTIHLPHTLDEPKFMQILEMLDGLLKSDHRKEMTVEEYETLKTEIAEAKKLGNKTGEPRLRSFLNSALSTGGSLASIISLALRDRLERLP